jgi:hypothetical protein
MRERLQKMVEVLSNAAEGRPELRRAGLFRAAQLAGGALSAAEPLPVGLSAWVDKVARQAWKTTPEDVEALKTAGVDEDSIFEVTVAAAVGASIGRYQTAMRAVAAVRDRSNEAAG